MRYLFLISISCILSCAPGTSNDTSIEALDESTDAELLYPEDTETSQKDTNNFLRDDFVEDINLVDPDANTAPDIQELPPYPIGPYDLEIFKIIPNMEFYDPWLNQWISLSDFYKDEKNKALLIVSSAGWCGPCLMEAAALIDIYEKYHFDGLEIIYTLGNTNVPGDTPFDTSLDDITSPEFYSDLLFMENWQLMTQDEAKKSLNYQMYADPKREFIKYLPQHAWPLSMLITTKDMGIRLIEEGYWSALMNNKIMLVLYNDVPTLPFKTNE